MDLISAAASLLGDVDVAIQTKVAEVAPSLLKETTNLDTVSGTGKTALALASEEGFGKAIECLIDNGASVDLRSEHGRRVLILITERGWLNAGYRIVEKALLAAEQEALEVARDRIFLVIAAYENDIDEPTELLDKGGLQLQSNDQDIGAAALFLAIEKGSVHLVKTLLKFGIDINSKDDSGQTALHRATRRQHIAMVELLLSKRAEVDSTDDDHRTPWSANLRFKDKYVLRLLLNAGADPNTCGRQGVSEMYKAAKNGDVGVVRYMLQSGTNASIKTQYGWTPLHWAAAYGHLACVRLLFIHYADVNAVSDQRATPLDLAFQANQKAMLELLCQHGAKPYESVRGSYYRTNEIEYPNVQSLAREHAKLRLCYDKPLTHTLLRPAALGKFVYPSGTMGASDNIYEVSHFLDTAFDTLSIRRSDTRAEMWHYGEVQFDSDDMLYKIVRMKANYQEFELQGHHQNALPGNMRMNRGRTGGWKLRHDLESNMRPYFLRTTLEWSKGRAGNSRWLIKDNVLQARSGGDDATPCITIELGVEQQLQDLIVTCWIVKLWSETALMQKQD